MAQPGSASVWGAGGRWFKSSRPDHFENLLEKNLRIFYSTTSNLKNAEIIAKKLLKEKKAVCINLIEKVKSYYLNNNSIESTQEVIMIIKTKLDKNHIEDFLQSIHNYEIPIIIEIKTTAPNKKYLEWFLKNSS